MSEGGWYKLQKEIIPGILEKEPAVVEKKILSVKPFARTIHVDLLDGKFAENTSLLDAEFFRQFSSDTIIEVHLMVDNPIQYIESFGNAGCKRFLGHVEMMPNQVDFVAKAQLYGEVGLALDKDTPVEKITVSYDDLDAVLVMTIKAGFSGQKCIPELLEKVAKIRGLAPQMPIEVDGGINEEIIPQALQKGATRFVTTSCLFSSADLAVQYKRLEELLR